MDLSANASVSQAYHYLNELENPINSLYFYFQIIINKSPIMSIKKENIKLEDVKPDIDKIKIKVEKEERKDPTSFLPDEPMVYELKKKKKKKRSIDKRIRLRI